MLDCINIYASDMKGNNRTSERKQRLFKEFLEKLLLLKKLYLELFQKKQNF